MRYLLIVCLAPLLVVAQKKKTAADPYLEAKRSMHESLQKKYIHYKDIALKIWDYAEVGYKEEKSTAL